MRIAVAADHAGFALKEHIKDRLQSAGHVVEDYGVNDTRSADYADFGRPAAQAVAYGKADRAILVDGLRARGGVQRGLSGRDGARPQ